MVRRGRHRGSDRPLGWDAPTRLASSLAAAAVLASVLVVTVAWQPNQLPLRFTPGDGAAATGPPRPAEQAHPTSTDRPGDRGGLTAAQPAEAKPLPSTAPDPTPDPPAADEAAEPTSEPAPPAPSAVLLIAAHSGKCAEVFGLRTHDGARAVQWDCHGGDNQHFQLLDAGAGHVTIRAGHSGKCLGAKDGSRRDQAPVVQVSCTGAASQQFRRDDAGGGQVRFVLRHSGKCLDVFGASQENDAPLIQWPCHHNPNQRWELNPA
ncbi:RICIN domain-containing protein [Natronosporangium hydrolyticum]|uniref:RICIN domain-containing protein n=1 Tax=Natronosporangium hydrolyticum TaxID=2811111 RepID=A0A895YE00_9ACTN|nr:RICIN domain-containing protein [Natronosporangium hydrolyticum]QSB16044.1 RICIN domain-containing protein [Natronosporangium hydrolyticum]